MLCDTLTPMTTAAPAADGANPNPEEIEGFVSLGEAEAAVEAGIARCAALRARLEPPPHSY